VPLTLRGDAPSNVFRLLGSDENSATFALGWALEKSPNLLAGVVAAIFATRLDPTDALLALQKRGGDGGYTDLEIHAGRAFHAILEAKRDWTLPSVAQLKRYAPRLAAGRARSRRLVTLSAADRAYAERRLPARIGGVAVTHLSWGDLAKLSARALKDARSSEERLWLRQWTQHLQEFVAMDRTASNIVYVVALRNTLFPGGGSRTGIEVVENDQRYFHPVGDGWPTQPPNYLGFRYRGRLQSVHHVDSFEVVDDLAKRNRRWPRTEGDHFLYRLGPPMRPAKPIRTGKLFRSQRVECAIDTLPSGAFDTVAEARDETKQRLAENA
jgi:hypothetical protein